MIKLMIKDETAPLEAVVLGTAMSLGGTPDLAHVYDPKSREHIIDGTFPKEEDLIRENEAFKAVLEKHHVKVYRPETLADTNQVYARDIGMVIDETFVMPNIIEDREHEKDGIAYLIDQVSPEDILVMPEGAHAEGGDVMPWKGRLFVGYSEEEDYQAYKVSRTNRAGLEFLEQHFSNYEVIGFELKKSDTDAKANALHLDCCFQPIGRDQCIIYKGGFKNLSDYEWLVAEFGADNCIEITQDEMYHMNSNVFSISPEVIVSEAGFDRLNTELERRGFTVERVPYTEISKMEGLFRCSTLPLKRSY
ncbi:MULTISPECIES: dimethylarginine dimethylaminohydrolase family protein [Reichenbachiella]|uniref:dimethylarginine dimethylaminohydrolase family protein n=1 Tax=Reichenbachiella TaxID=156993 RepID=UPI000E6CCF35|nr:MULTISPECIES: arginine deiminase-related protein [Reichenbachiella]MBU2914495.1 amidinotransferase [Reichenbachiella agariperforans]RJE73914.1 amidinotransferase [Reichenbachiella sp. MSK19-1]